MKKAGRKKVRKTKVKAKRKTGVKIPKMPKPLEKRVALEKPEKPEDVRVIEPITGDPIVQVRGKTVGAWIDL